MKWKKEEGEEEDGAALRLWLAVGQNIDLPPIYAGDDVHVRLQTCGYG